MKLVRLVLAFGPGAALVLAGCGPPPTLSPQPVASRRVVLVQHRWLELRLSRPQRSIAGRPLVLFITGDGGWHRKDLAAYRQLIQWGYPVAGFSAPEYLDHLAGGVQSLRPGQLAHDIRLIMDTSRAAFDRPASSPVVLVGVSRGADLAVVAAAQREVQTEVASILAIGLTREEEYVRRPRRLFRRARRAALAPAGASDDDLVMVAPYRALRWIQVPVCVIQSTHDEYVPAAEARELFGPDSAIRQFHAIESRNHSFTDARGELYRTMQSSLAWLASQPASSHKAERYP